MEDIIFLSLLLSKIKTEQISISLNDIYTDTTGDSYKIESKILTLNKNGDFKLSGIWSECHIVIKSGIEIKLIISLIKIDNSSIGPFIIKKQAKVNLILEGDSIITDNEPIENEESTDENIKDAFEGAGIKFKSSSTLIISCTGKLTINGRTKKGIKGGSKSSLTINDGTIFIFASKNALACDNLLTINGGKIQITSQSDGIKAEPDSDDSDSQGTIIINGGTLTINSQNDAIQAAYKLIINGGTFDIIT